MRLTVDAGLITALAVAGCASASAPQSAPDGWSLPFDVANVPTRTFAKVALAGNGDAVFAWVGGGRVQTRSRSASGELGPVVAVSGPGAGAPRVAAAAGGGALMTWVRGRRVQARMRAADGRVGPVLAVSARGERSSGPRVSAAANGVAVLAWTAADGRGSEAQRRASTRITARLLSAGKLKAAVVVAALQAGRSWQVAGGDGAAVFVWEQGRGGDRRIYARTLSASGLTQAVAVSAAGARAILPHVAVAADGRALVAWTHSVPGAADDELDRVQARWLSKTGTTAGSIIDVSTRTPNPDPQIAIDRLAGGVVVWAQTRVSDGQRRVLTRSLSRDGGRGRTVEIAPGPQAGSAKVATSSDGSATFGWLASDADYANRRIQTRTRSAAGALTPVVTLASSVEGDIWPDADVYPQLAVAATGAAAVTWAQMSAGSATAQAAVRP